MKLLSDLSEEKKEAFYRTVEETMRKILESDTGYGDTVGMKVNIEYDTNNVYYGETSIELDSTGYITIDGGMPE